MEYDAWYAQHKSRHTFLERYVLSLGVRPQEGRKMVSITITTAAALQLLVAAIAIASLVYNLVLILHLEDLEAMKQQTERELAAQTKRLKSVAWVRDHLINGTDRIAKEILDAMDRAKEKAVANGRPVVIPGGTVAGWQEAIMGLHVIMQMRRGKLNCLRLNYGPGRGDLPLRDIEQLVPYKAGIRWILQRVKADNCPFWIDISPTQSHEGYVEKDFARILDRIEAHETAAA